MKCYKLNVIIIIQRVSYIVQKLTIAIAAGRNLAILIYENNISKVAFKSKSQVNTDRGLHDFPSLERSRQHV